MIGAVQTTQTAYQDQVGIAASVPVIDDFVTTAQIDQSSWNNSPEHASAVEPIGNISTALPISTDFLLASWSFHGEHRMRRRRTFSKNEYNISQTTDAQ